MNVYPIPESLADQYHGSGYAIASVSGHHGHVLSLSYVRDLIKEWDDESPDIDLIASDHRVRTIAQIMERHFGRVVFGMVSCWEFCEL